MDDLSKMPLWRVRVRSDQGVRTLRVAGRDEQAAREIVKATERCPDRAILTIVQVADA